VAADPNPLVDRPRPVANSVVRDLTAQSRTAAPSTSGSRRPRWPARRISPRATAPKLLISSNHSTSRRSPQGVHGAGSRFYPSR
jgi:hypothetical protein